MAWVFYLYFIQGLPFGIFGEVLPTYFRLQGISLAHIGAASLLQLPWSLKVLWAPLVDRAGRPQRFVVVCLLLLACIHAAFAGLMVNGALGWGPPVMLLMLALAATSATQDLAIDGYFIKFVDETDKDRGNGVRVAAYRMAMVVGGGGMLLVAGHFSSWPMVFGVAGVSFMALAAGVSFAPRVAQPEPSDLKTWLQGFSAWLRGDHAAGIFAFVLLYKAGDLMMVPMTAPFWVDRGMSAGDIGLMKTAVGVGVTIAGALAGGAFTGAFGMFRALWILGIVQATSILAYAAVSFFEGGRLALYAASAVENLALGLGTAALMALLSRLCSREHAATQFALLTALMGLVRSVCGWISGHAAQTLGYTAFFIFSFCMSLPAFAFLPSVRRRLSDEEPKRRT